MTHDEKLPAVTDAVRNTIAPGAPRALRVGLPFGVVMATGASSQIARLLAVGFAVQPLLWLAVAEAGFIAGRGLLRHRAELRAPLTAWTRVGLPAEHAGVLTVPLGLAVTTTGLAAQVERWATALTLIGLVLTWATGLVFTAQFLASLAKCRPASRTMDGGWFLAPAALLGAAIASVASMGYADSYEADLLRSAALVAAAAGLAGYWSLTVSALVRFARERLDDRPGVLWWIWAGCGGLAGAAMSKALGAKGASLGPTLVALLRPLTTATWIAGGALLVPVILVSLRFVLSQWTVAPFFPWPPTFSTAVIALGAFGVAHLTRLGPIGTVGQVTGYATLVGWLATTAWNALGLLRSSPAACTRARCDYSPDKAPSGLDGHPKVGS